MSLTSGKKGFSMKVIDFIKQQLVKYRYSSYRLLRSRGFVSLDTCEIVKLCSMHFSEFVIDSMMFRHGTVLFARK